MKDRNMRWKAQWIWEPEPEDAPNTYVLFRKRFRCRPGAADDAVLHISAGHFYEVYVNGRFVGRGPDRCYFRQKYFHSYPVGGQLRAGENLIAVQCHYLGRSSRSIMERHAAGPAGLIVQLNAGATIVARTDRTWRVLRNPAYSPDTLPPNFHREWIEEFDAEAEPHNWRRPRFDDRAWREARIVADAEGGPWSRLVPKQTAELTAELITPANAYIDAPQHLLGEDADYDEAAFHNLSARSPQREAGEFWIRNGRMKTRRIVFDLGQVMAGFPRIDISQCHGGQIEIYYGDSLSMTHCDTIRLGTRPLVWTPFTHRGGRYFRIDISGADDPISFRSIRWVRTNYPVVKRGAFACADPRLNAIWDLCCRSAETCGMEHLVDCVHREQVLWMMDFRFQAPQHYAFFGDTALALKCFRQFAALQLSNGHILCYGPSARPLDEVEAGVGGRAANDFFGFNFYFILAVWEYFQFTGSREFLEEFVPVCRRCLAYHRSSEQGGFAHSGAVKGRSFVDWGYQGFVKNDAAVYSFTQALYYGALDAYGKLCTALDLAEEAKRIAAHAKRLRRRFMAAFVNPRSGRIADCVVGKRRFMKGTVHPYMAAARFLNDVPPEMLDVWLDAISDARLAPSCSGYGTTLAVEALQRNGRYGDALDLLARYWGAMVDAGLTQTPEFFDVRLPKGMESQWSPATSMCHSYASMAGVLLQQMVLGATVKGRQVVLSPWFGPLASAQGVVPTVGGDVHVEWTSRDDRIVLDVKAPAGVEVRFEPVHEARQVEFRCRRVAMRK